MTTLQTWSEGLIGVGAKGPTSWPRRPLSKYVFYDSMKFSKVSVACSQQVTVEVIALVFGSDFFTYKAMEIMQTITQCKLSLLINFTYSSLPVHEATPFKI